MATNPPPPPPPPPHGFGGGCFGNNWLHRGSAAGSNNNNNNIESYDDDDDDGRRRRNNDGGKKQQQKSSRGTSGKQQQQQQQQHHHGSNSLFCGKSSVGTLYVDPVVEEITRLATTESSAEEWVKAIDEVYGSQYDPELEFDFPLDVSHCSRSATTSTVATSNTNDDSNSNNMMMMETEEEEDDDDDDDDDDLLSPTEVERLRAEFVSNKINDLLTAIDRLPNNVKRRNLDKAFFIRPTLKSDTGFLLMFLRSTDYDTSKAAMKLRLHFNTKYELFGIEKLVRDITIDDFTSKELELISKSGCYARYLNIRDRIGRPIELHDGRYMKVIFENLTTFKKWIWYEIMNMYKNNDIVQKFGLVSILYVPFTEQVLEEMKIVYNSMQSLKKILEVNDSLPYKVTSYHFCYDHTIMNFTIAGASTAFGKPLRLRLATHYGSSLEIAYSLESKYGIKIPSNLFEDNTDDTEIATSIQEYVAERKIIEQQEREDLAKMEATTYIVVFPQPQDFLIEGRRQKGSILSCIEFPGNKRLAILCNNCATEYSSLEYNFEKEKLINGVIQEFRDGGGGSSSRNSKTSTNNNKISASKSGDDDDGGGAADDDRMDVDDDDDNTNPDDCMAATAAAAPGGRFLKRVDNGWMVVKDNIAYQKAWRIINDAVNG